MFPISYFPPTYFPASYFPEHGGVPMSSTGGFFPPTYFPPSFFAPTFFPDGAGTVAPTPSASTEPNPAETAWTLGVGGAVVAPGTAAGFAVTLATTLRNAGLIVPFDPASVLDASAWSGGGEAALFAPAVAWISAPAGTLTLSVVASQTATLEPGDYRLQVGVTPPGGGRVLAFDGTFKVGDAPGSTAVGVPWCSYQDMLDYCDQIRTLQAKGVDRTNFLNERIRATQKRSRMIVTRYDPRPGRVKVRSNVMDPVAGQDVPSSTAVAPGKAQVTAALATTGGLILEEKVREIVARDAIAIVLRRQAVGGSSRDYASEADAEQAAADALFRCYQAQLDLSSPLDGVADALIDRDAILLPPGTSP